MRQAGFTVEVGIGGRADCHTFSQYLLVELLQLELVEAAGGALSLPPCAHDELEADGDGACGRSSVGIRALSSMK